MRPDLGTLFLDKMYNSTNLTLVTRAVSQFVVTASPTETMAGDPVTVTVQAKDAQGNVLTSYQGTVHFASSDGQATLPPDTALSNGTGTFSITLRTAGTQTITVANANTANGTASGTATVTVDPAAASSFAIAGFDSPTARKSPGTFTLTVVDAYGKVVTGYTGTVHFTSDSADADLPADYTFTAADAGVHTFQATFNRFGTSSLTATDTADPGISATLGGIEVV